TGHDADGSRQTPHPLSHAAFLPIPGVAFIIQRKGSVDVALTTGRCHDRAKMLLARDRPVESGVAAVSQMMKSALQEMFGGEMGNGMIVAFDRGNAGKTPRGTHINGRQARAADSMGHRIRFDSGDDAIPPPMREPAGWTCPPLLFWKADRPGF